MKASSPAERANKEPYCLSGAVHAFGASELTVFMQHHVRFRGCFRMQRRLHLYWSALCEQAVAHDRTPVANEEGCAMQSIVLGPLTSFLWEFGAILHRSFHQSIPSAPKTPYYPPPTDFPNLQPHTHCRHCLLSHHCGLLYTQGFLGVGPCQFLQFVRNDFLFGLRFSFHP